MYLVAVGTIREPLLDGELGTLPQSRFSAVHLSLWLMALPSGSATAGDFVSRGLEVVEMAGATTLYLIFLGQRVEVREYAASGL